MDNRQFTKLCSRAWSLQILSCLAMGDSARPSPIAHKLGVGRTALSASFSHLIELNLLARNPGHGHPLRPEYKLTELGQQVANWALMLDQQVKSENDWLMIRKTWTLPILREAILPISFGNIRSNLVPITDRALSISLKNMCQEHWLDRHVETVQAPIRVSYSITQRIEGLVPILESSHDFALSQSWDMMFMVFFEP